MQNKVLNGILITYSATGEDSRPQFIGNNSLNENGQIVNYNEVYDLDISDSIRFVDEYFNNEWLEINNSYIWRGLLYLPTFYKKEIQVQFKPSKDSKSWAEYAK